MGNQKIKERKRDQGKLVLLLKQLSLNLKLHALRTGVRQPSGDAERPRRGVRRLLRRAKSVPNGAHAHGAIR